MIDDELGQARMAALEDVLEKLEEAVRSPVDGRDRLAALNPKHWHYCNITVRIGGKDVQHEGDFLKDIARVMDWLREVVR